MTPKINFKNLICGLLPWQKRQPNRLALLRAFVTPLVAMFNDFDKWRTDTRMIARVTSQVKVFEGYLRKKYKEPISIKIVTYDDGAMSVGLEAEGQMLMLGLIDEQIPSSNLPLDGEIRQLFDDVNFIVYAPRSIDKDQLLADIERFRTAGTLFKIIAK